MVNISKLPNNHSSRRGDLFFWIRKINEASTVISRDEGFIDNDLALRIVRGLRDVIDKGNQEGGERPNRVIFLNPS
jgi:hypothetical protein